MRTIIQRVKSASVSIDNSIKSKIDIGLLILVGIEHEDTAEDVEWLAKKIVNLRIFSDEDKQMNLSLLDIQGEILVISQFTLHAKTKKGNRPSYIKAAPPSIAIPLYNSFLTALNNYTRQPIGSGEFGADMQVELINDGPVTISIDSKARE
ncbi:D-aminoacyl-tRNA deacylase [Crocinitomix catalasitica]|uniref:D-aminoacyl-tRNA deacylase n=1 Tax=Crocinitomix catalasitica TaxID=184607 RepID=UPI00048A1D84|nr:D-aminoacyl-tRNA deacylase [Crocinitomix catalasitica]